MAYERMTLSSFSEHLKAGKYDTATGARRAVGKATDWSAHDKNLAAGAINTHFGDDAGAKSAPRAAKKIVAKAPKKASKKSAAKAVVKAAAPVVEKKAAKATPAKRAVSRRTPTMKSTPPAAVAEQTDYASFALPIRTVTTPALIGEAVLRQNNASNVVVAMSALQSRDADEQLLYKRAMACASESFAAAPTAAAPKSFVSLREQMAPQTAPAGVSTADPKALAIADTAARAMTGPSYGTTSNAAPAAQPLG